ncbi:MAG: bifunctional folylpolyglutamate synthase/dihydrofolate synthase [Alicyclobacillus herbarius]|uniref:glutamate ligase domain-containing protein n=1 Tax=Alicyclobacillus herbarius TaxID=122960 RepID=UPI002353E176|nr:bifunctional folylpolyglutamate synthase/dihydrofolate synthase [Alicyclobacillus herbarius]MCL6632243.1 bifunctional folylpolyglutamate synthase/dihydrofolate synthase [Alicyclobacillus herbarius]
MQHVVTQPTRTTRETIALVYEWYNRARPYLQPGPDRLIRHPEWTRRLLNQLGSPDQDANNVAVTGSKGKGSNAILLAAILQRLGLRVGLFTGPHLVDFMERFRLDGQVMPEPEFIRWMTFVYNEARQLPIPTSQYIGPVGLLAVVATLWFRQQATDVNIFELGRGALHDDVNQVSHQGAVLTPVFLEHKQELGPTLEDVAREKAGVLTRDTRWLVSHPQSAPVQKVLNDAWQGQACHIESVPEKGAGAPDIGTREGETWVTVPLVYGRETRIRLPYMPGFLAQNAAVAAVAAQRVMQDLRGPDYILPPEINLTSVRLPGRMDVISHRPFTLVDGTIHQETAVHVAAWVEALRRVGKARRFAAVVAIPVDKDGDGVLGALAGVIDWVILTGASNPHLRFDNRWLHAAEKYGILAEWLPDVEEAFAVARARTEEADGLLLLGTQSFVADAMRHFGGDTRNIWREAEGDSLAPVDSMDTR